MLEIIAQRLEQPGHAIERAGRLGRDRLALLLRATDSESAEAVAQSVAQACDGCSQSIEWSVETYPGSRRNSTATPESTDCPQSAAPAQNNHSDANRRTPKTVPFDCIVPRITVCPCPPWKRVMDVCGAGLGLVALSPLLLAVVVWTKCVSRGPVFFRQRRYGLGGRPFMLWKFRTMEPSDASERHCSHVADLMESDLPLAKRDGDLRLIRGGAVLRKLGVDELPQLINVLFGEMSLVGPRPDVVPLEQYRVWQRRRFDVLPGMTGLWQVSGKNETTFSTMMQMDIAYIRRRSFWLDLTILCRTIPAVARN